jgi:hypothetical protein
MNSFTSLSITVPTYQEIQTYIQSSKGKVVLLKDLVTDTLSPDNPLTIYSILSTPFLLTHKTHGTFIVNIDRLHAVEDTPNKSENVLNCYVWFCRYYTETIFNQEKRHSEDIQKFTSWTQGNLFIRIPNDYYEMYKSIKSHMVNLGVENTYYQPKIKVSLKKIPDVNQYSFTETTTTVSLSTRLSSVFSTLNSFKSNFDIKRANNELTITNYVSALKKLKGYVENLEKNQKKMDYNLSAVNEFIAYLITSLETVLSLIAQLNNFSNIILKIKPRLGAQEYVLEKPMFYKDGITKTQSQITVQTPKTSGFLGGKRRRRKSRKPRHKKTRRNTTHRKHR